MNNITSFLLGLVIYLGLALICAIIINLSQINDISNLKNKNFEYKTKVNKLENELEILKLKW